MVEFGAPPKKIFLIFFQIFCQNLKCCWNYVAIFVRFLSRLKTAEECFHIFYLVKKPFCWILEIARVHFLGIQGRKCCARLTHRMSDRQIVKQKDKQKVRIAWQQDRLVHICTCHSANNYKYLHELTPKTREQKGG